MEPQSIHKRVTMQDRVAEDGWAPRYPLLNNAVVDTFGERLKAQRIAKGLSQPALAEASGVSQSTISRIERGDGGYTYENARALARALGVSVADLAGDASTSSDEATEQAPPTSGYHVVPDGEALSGSTPTSSPGTPRSPGGRQSSASLWQTEMRPSQKRLPALASSTRM